MKPKWGSFKLHKLKNRNREVPNYQLQFSYIAVKYQQQFSYNRIWKP